MNLVPPSQMSPADLARVSELAPELFALGAVGDFVLDTVLDRLREHFRERYAGWTPVIGKNRQLTQSIEGGVIIRDDEYPPSRVAAPQWTYRDRTGPGAGVRVGLLDTPFAPHPWLDGGWDNENGVLLTEDEPNWRGGHATFLTGLILRQAPGATVVIRSALNEQGVASSWDFANALAEFAESNNAQDPADRVQIINISSGAFAYDGQEPLAINRALATLDPEVVVVAAAGNHGADPRTRRDGRPYAWPRRPLYPSAAAPVLAVGSAQADGRRSTFSPDVPWVDVQGPRGEGDQHLSQRIGRRIRGAAGRRSRVVRRRRVRAAPPGSSTGSRPGPAPRSRPPWSPGRSRPGPGRASQPGRPGRRSAPRCGTGTCRWRI